MESEDSLFDVFLEVYNNRLMVIYNTFFGKLFRYGSFSIKYSAILKNKINDTKKSLEIVFYREKRMDVAVFFSKDYHEIHSVIKWMMNNESH